MIYRGGNASYRHAAWLKAELAQRLKGMALGGLEEQASPRMDTLLMLLNPQTQVRCQGKGSAFTETWLSFFLI